MNSTINSINLLIKILWHSSNSNKKLEALFVSLFSIFSSLLQYTNIIITAFTFSFITSFAYSEKNFFELDLLFGNKILLQQEDFLNIIFFWLISSIITYLSVIFSTFSLYKLAYSLGKSLSNKILKISLSSNSLFSEHISEKTIFNLLTSENSMLIKGSISALISLPMQLVTLIALISIILKYSIYLIFLIPAIALIYILISNLIFKSVTKKGKKVFNLRSLQTDILSRIIDNPLDVKFPPSDKEYNDLFNKTTTNLRNIESLLATIPKALKAFLELLIILVIGFYIFYSISLLNLPLEYFISYSSAVILSLFKLTPLISALSSNFVSFNAQYESIKNYSSLIKNSKNYNLYTKSINYAQIFFGDNYKLSFEELQSERIKKYSKNNILNLKLDQIKLLWITGKSGCGKSTFISLVGGMRPVNKGKIKLIINKRIKSNYIQEYIAYMPQNPIFHSIKVLDYIRDGDPNLNNTKLRNIINKLKIANSFGMSTKNLLNLVIGPKGYNPSGGQSKLLAFARALYKKNTYLYLLDEPTSDLSEEFREIVLSTIYDLAKEKFVLCITHDLSSIRENDIRLKL
tara:strand:+ start:2486 stop:4213 length:1728 start_codon:yes stop_codon:yes gene_type:complete